MTPDAPNSNENGLRWVSLAEAAAAWGVSQKTVRRRITEANIDSYKEPSPRGGFVWKVALNSSGQAVGHLDKNESVRLDKPSRQRVQSDVIHVQIAAESPTGQVDRIVQPDKPIVVHTDRTGEVELLREALAREREMNATFKGIIEGLQQSEAQTKAALREALKAMPKQLTSGAPETETQEVLTNAVSSSWQEHVAPQKSLQSVHEDETLPSSYDGLADWLEARMAG